MSITEAGVVVEVLVENPLKEITPLPETGGNVGSLLVVGIDLALGAPQ